MKAERLVIDTNVWIAALISPAGTARQFVNAVLDLETDILMSESTFNELGSWIEDAGTTTGTSRDAEDDKFLALAVTGQADAIVSGDRDLLDLVAHEGIPILTPATLLQRLREP